ncbi:GNAT family N-acetyltransferase [Tumebacillus algifaecis]|uniref:GNAT family N-acetyltransferase n=1 Tax=Tumebacillus algifaecis TaxID=1214604 RepID=A0A223CYG2_9BACL|nr:GNAT family protein [Tumebacillus algifaecis]ASS74147.1 GNAT family N-acetyltransferase [Tumebacillus algifaecis]
MSVKLELISMTGSHVRLEPITLEHAVGLYEAAQAEEIWTYLPYPIDSLAKAQFFIEEAIEQVAKGTELVFVIIEQGTDRIIGSTRYLDISIPHRGLEIGWTWLHPSVWRSQVNSECKYLLLRYAFETLGCIRVQLKTDARNLRSQAAIARLGAVREGTLRNHRILPDGYRRDSVYFSILDTEWADVKARLESWID